MHHLRPLILTLLVAVFFFPAAISAKEFNKDGFTFDLSWRQKPRYSLKVWGTLKGEKSCNQLKTTILFDNTRKKNLAVSTDIAVKNYKRNSIIEISEVLKVQGTSVTDRYWVVDDISIECENED